MDTSPTADVVVITFPSSIVVSIVVVTKYAMANNSIKDAMTDDIIDAKSPIFPPFKNNITGNPFNHFPEECFIEV